ncbi:MAG: UDP-glucose 4-epimerase GalE [Succinivibrio sp.]|jgi:UDP-glucose 4-epimerase|nr:UDP-glucose 4-epimerase GalE [Succinivibrio sp.]
MSTILVTGGAGYIGSHTVIELAEAGYDAVIFDNFSNSKPAVLERINKICGRSIPFVAGDIRSREQLENVFSQYQIDGVINFAGLKAVGESVKKPLEYYDNNVNGARTLLAVMRQFKCHSFIFSSSATVYGEPDSVPLTEESPVKRANCPYGQTKVDIEYMCEELQHACPEFSMVLLRYFNPVGAHESGLIGEDPRGIPNNLMPYLCQVAVGRLPHLNVFGNDYPTPDGTCVRDYIHVVDLAKGHVAALKHCLGRPGVFIYNLGTGTGYSVLDMVKAFSKAIGRPLPYKFAPRRAGDVVQCYADPSKAQRELGWKAEKTLDEMAADSYNWQKNNPNGYDD